MMTLLTFALLRYYLLTMLMTFLVTTIAPLFDLCNDDHNQDNQQDLDHDHEGKRQLGEVARLDTCITVVDSFEFHKDLASMKTYEQADIVGTIAELMMEQVLLETIRVAIFAAG